MTALKALYIILLELAIAYILLVLYFEHRTQKRNEQYKKNARKIKKRIRRSI